MPTASAAVSDGKEKATASKSLTILASNLNVARNSLASMTQEQLVSSQRCPFTGPAMARTAFVISIC
jgi:hypothetical protein